MLNSISSRTVSAADKADMPFEAAKDRTTLGRDDFMKLFVKQLQYQDPMNPMESAEMASQIAQFNMVDLMYQNNDAMERLVESDESRTRMQAVTYLGHDVRYAGNSLVVDPDGPKPFDMAIEDQAASCVVAIRDDQGHVVRNWDLGPVTAGKYPLEWDGTDADGEAVPEGIYTVGILALDESGEVVQTAAWTTGTVANVVFTEDGRPRLTVEGGAEITLDEIWMVGT